MYVRFAVHMYAYFGIHMYACFALHIHIYVFFGIHLYVRFGMHMCAHYAEHMYVRFAVHMCHTHARMPERTCMQFKAIFMSFKPTFMTVCPFCACIRIFHQSPLRNVGDARHVQRCVHMSLRLVLKETICPQSVFDAPKDEDHARKNKQPVFFVVVQSRSS